MSETTLVTGVAGFIGFHTAKQLLQRGTSVIGIDNVNDYYDPKLKEDRLSEIEKISLETGTYYNFSRINIADANAINVLFKERRPENVINLAAQAGVRYSLENPHAYVESNIVGFTNILEACRHNDVKHLTYASTSSVYGANTQMPFSEKDGVNHPLQFYAATKRANELMAHSYSHLFGLPTTGLRFFTVYGPWGRPDMALFLFTRNILEGKPIKVFNKGNHTRDFTYVEDIAKGVVRVSDNPAKADLEWDSNSPDPDCSNAPFRIYNIGNNKPVKLMEYIAAIENIVGVQAKIDLLPLQPGDVPSTYADIESLTRDLGFKPQTQVTTGVRNFIQWYRAYYGV